MGSAAVRLRRGVAEAGPLVWTACRDGRGRRRCAGSPRGERGKILLIIFSLTCIIQLVFYSVIVVVFFSGFVYLKFSVDHEQRVAITGAPDLECTTRWRNKA
jgi:hypothetical protein